MSEILPTPWLMESSIYIVKIGGGIVTTAVVDSIAVLDIGISELRRVLKTHLNPFVGIDVVNNGDMLLLYAKSRCLIIQFKRMMSMYYLTDVPSSLAQFLTDGSITFVGPRNISQRCTLSYISAGRNKEYRCDRIVDIGYLVAKMRKNPKLLTSTLEELTVEVEIDIKRPIISEGSVRPNWQSSSVLSDEEVKLAMYEVYSCYQIANKLTVGVRAVTGWPK